MAVITGYTAERMKDIEDNTVVDGTIVGEHLHLIKRNNEIIDAGRVRGDVGPRGPQGLPGKDASFAGYKEPYVDFDGVSGDLTLDFSVSNVWQIRPNGTINIKFANFPPTGFAAPGTMWFRNPNYAVTWPLGTLFPNGDPPDISKAGVLSILATSEFWIVGVAWSDIDHDWPD